MLSKLEEMGYVQGIITQNVDGYHESSGSKNIVTYHGNINKYVSVEIKKGGIVQTGELVDREYLIEDGVLNYRKDGKIWKPDVVLFGEMISEEKDRLAKKMIRDANVILVVGTSFKVHPFCLLPKANKVKNSIVYLINNEKVSSSHCKHGVLGDTSEVLKNIYNSILEKSDTN